MGRTNATIRFVVWGTLPLGLLVAGGLAIGMGLHPAMRVSAAVGSLAFLGVLLSAARRAGTTDTPLIPASAPAPASEQDAPVVGRDGRDGGRQLLDPRLLDQEALRPRGRRLQHRVPAGVEPEGENADRPAGLHARRLGQGVQVHAGRL
jgi:hypothetical protein